MNYFESVNKTLLKITAYIFFVTAVMIISVITILIGICIIVDNSIAISHWVLVDKAIGSALFLCGCVSLYFLQKHEVQT